MTRDAAPTGKFLATPLGKICIIFYKFLHNDHLYKYDAFWQRNIIAEIALLSLNSLQVSARTRTSKGTAFSIRVLIFSLEWIIVHPLFRVLPNNEIIQCHFCQFVIQPYTNRNVFVEETAKKYSRGLAWATLHIIQYKYYGHFKSPYELVLAL